MHLLWQARAVAYGARGDESRFLLDPNSGAAFQQAFDARVAQLTDADGLLARELSSASFPGEKISAGAAQRDFLAFLQVDRRLRGARRGPAPRPRRSISPWAPRRTARWRRSPASIRRSATPSTSCSGAFVAQTVEGEDTLRRLAIAVPLLGMLVIAASLFAVQARLREYAT